MFEIGTLVTGLKNSGYSYTNGYSLCLVIDNDDSNIRVKIIAHDDKPNSLGESFWVNTKYFYRITLEEYFEKFPDAEKCDDFESIISDYNCSMPKKEDPDPNAFKLSDEQRKELLDEIMTLLRDFDYNPTEEACNKILDEWAKKKGNLIQLLEKHPAYNGKFQITFDSDFKRDVDKSVIDNFFEYLGHVIDKREYVIGHWKYSELNKIISDAVTCRGILRNYSHIKTINDHNLNYYEKVVEKFTGYRVKYMNRSDLFFDHDHCFDAETYRLYDKITNLRRYIYYADYNQFANEELVARINCLFPEVKAVKGQKVSKIINKICTMYGFNKDENYNKKFAKFSDAINPLSIKRHTVLSVHPVDYLTMSFGNSWSSCHTIDKKNKRNMPNSYHGQYSGGTLSYMLDETSAVFYTVDKSYDGDKIELEPKINRNMFHIGNNKIVQGRVYPQTSDGNGDTYTEIRNIVQKVIADCIGRPNMWTLKRGTSECEKVIISKGVHYRDYENFESCNVSYLKLDNDEIDENKITVGHTPICPCCGETHHNSEAIECEGCYTEDDNDSDDDFSDDDF